MLSTRPVLLLLLLLTFSQHCATGEAPRGLPAPWLAGDLAGDVALGSSGMKAQWGRCCWQEEQPPGLLAGRGLQVPVVQGRMGTAP